MTIPANTLVTMTNIDALNSKTIQKGDVVRFAVADDICVGDVIAIPRGMEVNGTVTKPVNQAALAKTERSKSCTITFAQRTVRQWPLWSVIRPRISINGRLVLSALRLPVPSS